MLHFRFCQKFNVVMICKETLRPLSLIVMYFLFFVMSGLTPIRPNMVNICDAFGMADDGKNVVVRKILNPKNEVVCLFEDHAKTTE